MPDPRYGIESPCRPADRQPDQLAGAPAVRIPRTTSYGFDSPEPAVERFDARQVVGRPAHGRALRALVIHLASTTPLAGDEPRAGAAPRERGRLPLGITLLGHVRGLYRLTKATG